MKVDQGWIHRWARYIQTVQARQAIRGFTKVSIDRYCGVNARELQRKIINIATQSEYSNLTHFRHLIEVLAKITISLYWPKRFPRKPAVSTQTRLSHLKQLILYF